MALLNLPEYVATQATERYRAFIIYGPAMSGKTRLARRMQEQLRGYVLDLQSYFSSHPALAAHIDTFGPLDLEELLLSLDVPEMLVIVDNMDFLLNTWARKHSNLDNFVAMVDRRLASPTVTQKTFVFLIQSDAAITRHELTNTRQQPRILPLTAFYDL